VDPGASLFGLYGVNEPAAMFYRDNVKNSNMKQYGAYLSDTLTMGKLTAQVGVRYDYQWGQNVPFTVSCCKYDQATWPQSPLTSLSVPGTEP